MSWTDARVATLRRMWAEGETASQIAKELGGVTRNAVLGKAYKLGLHQNVKKDATMAIDIQRANPVVEQISNDNQLIAGQVTNLMNQIALTRAMQEGYRMACRDNGLPVPDMEDPRVTYGFGGVA